ncbi:uncharacterized protein BXZ73DRAFT_103342 [Epithele typhae]|uniref:uncharacterized protein n=1 Tax=Epithele typhae TaxID=378194 RepID=UPI0020080167|nr:uncharacterized protein BXZ73DRAFT_103342 [Epithele typhae]KAH9924965.1 hypothetical protein BXZ73DRAFT_103342 [Epithele typhae]
MSVLDKVSLMDPTPRTIIHVLTSIFSKYLREHDNISKPLFQGFIHRDGVVAVTGKALPDGVHILIAMTSNSFQERPGTGYSVHSVTPSNEEVDLQNLCWKGSSGSPITMRRYAGDLLRVLTDYMTKGLPEGMGELSIGGWITSRCYDAVVRRIKLQDTHWSNPLSQTLCMWKPTDLDGKIFSGVDTEICLSDHDKDWAQVLIGEMLPETSDFTRATAPQWIKILGLLVAYAREKCDDKGPLDERFCVIQCLRVVFVILECKAVERVFQLPSLSDMFARKSFGGPPELASTTPASAHAPSTTRTTSTPSLGTSFRQDGSTVGDEGGGEDDGSENDDDDRYALAPERGEAGGHVVFRYLLMIVSPLKASLTILNTIKRLRSVPRVSILELGKGAETYTQEDCDHVLKALCAHTAKHNAPSERLGVVTSWLSDVFRDNVKNREGLPVPPVHVEAELMSFLNSEPPPDSPQAVRDLHEDFVESSLTSLPLGVSRQACNGCTMLSERTHKLDNIYGPAVCLSASHGQTVPWDPPAPGVPDDVLVQIAEGLQRKGDRRTSTRRNPVSITLHAGRFTVKFSDALCA